MWGLCACAAGLAFVTAFYAITFFIRVEDGTVKIEIDDPQAVVYVDGDEIRIENLGAPIHLKPGKHLLEIKRGDVTVKTDDFTITQGTRTVLRVSVPPVLIADAGGNDLHENKPQQPSSPPLSNRPPDGPSATDSPAVVTPPVPVDNDPPPSQPLPVEAPASPETPDTPPVIPNNPPPTSPTKPTASVSTAKFNFRGNVNGWVLETALKRLGFEFVFDDESTKPLLSRKRGPVDLRPDATLEEALHAFLDHRGVAFRIDGKKIYLSKAATATTTTTSIDNKSANFKFALHHRNGKVISETMPGRAFFSLNVAKKMYPSGKLTGDDKIVIDAAGKHFETQDIEAARVLLLAIQRAMGAGKSLDDVMKNLPNTSPAPPQKKPGRGGFGGGGGGFGSNKKN